MIKLLDDVCNVAYSLSPNINEIVLGFKLYKVFVMEVANRWRYENANPNIEEPIYYNNIKVTCDYNNPILIQVK